MVFLWDSDLRFLITYSIVYLFFLYDYISYRYKVLKGKLLVIGRNPNSKSNFYIGFIGGFLFVIWGIFNRNSSLSFFGLGNEFYFGVLCIIMSLIPTSRKIVQISNKTMIYFEEIFWSEWPLRKIDRVLITNERLVFERGNKILEITIEENELAALNQIKEFLKPRMDDKLVIE